MNKVPHILRTSIILHATGLIPTQPIIVYYFLNAERDLLALKLLTWAVWEGKSWIYLNVLSKNRLILGLLFKYPIICKPRVEMALASVNDSVNSIEETRVIQMSLYFLCSMDFNNPIKKWAGQCHHCSTGDLV